MCIIFQLTPTEIDSIVEMFELKVMSFGIFAGARSDCVIRYMTNGVLLIYDMTKTRDESKGVCHDNDNRWCLPCLFWRWESCDSVNSVGMLFETMFLHVPQVAWKRVTLCIKPILDQTKAMSSDGTAFEHDKKFTVFCHSLCCSISLIEYRHFSSFFI